jgi:hypothetical protein
MDLTSYPSLLRDSLACRLLAGLTVSSLGDGMSSAVTTRKTTTEKGANP